MKELSFMVCWNAMIRTIGFQEWVVNGHGSELDGSEACYGVLASFGKDHNKCFASSRLALGVL